MNTCISPPSIQSMISHCKHGKPLTEVCLDCNPEPRPKRKYVRKAPPVKNNPRKSHIGTLNRGRKPTKPRANQQTHEAFQRVLATGHPKSLMQWAQLADIPYPTVLQWSRGENVPLTHMAIKLARAAGVTVEDIFGHLTD